MAPTRFSPLLWTYCRIGPATMGAAGRQVRKVCRLAELRMPPAPAFTRNSGTLLCSAIRAVASPTSLEMIPPTATTRSRSISRSIARAPSSALDWSSATTSSSWRPPAPPALLISFTASCIPARTCTPQGVKLPVSDVSTPIRIGSPLPAPDCVSPPPPQAASSRATTSNRENCPPLERCLIVSSGLAGFHCDAAVRSPSRSAAREHINRLTGQSNAGALLPAGRDDGCRSEEDEGGARAPRGRDAAARAPGTGRRLTTGRACGCARTGYGRRCRSTGKSSSSGPRRRPARPGRSRTTGRSHGRRLGVQAALQAVPSLPWQVPVLPSPGRRILAEAQLDADLLEQGANPVQVRVAQLLVAQLEQFLALQRLHSVLAGRPEPAEHLLQRLVHARLQLPEATWQADELADPAVGEVPVELLLFEHARHAPGERLVAAAGQRLQHRGGGPVDQQQRGDRVRPGRKRRVQQRHVVGALALGRVNRPGEGQLRQQRVQHPGLAQLALRDCRAGHPDLQARRADRPFRQVPAEPVLVVGQDDEQVHDGGQGVVVLGYPGVRRGRPRVSHHRPPDAPGSGRESSGWSAPGSGDRKSTRLNSSHVKTSYAVFCLKKKKTKTTNKKTKIKTNARIEESCITQSR